MIVMFDALTSKWMRAHPMTETTVVKCECCGLFYKPMLGHKCKKSDTARHKKERQLDGFIRLCRKNITTNS